MLTLERNTKSYMACPDCQGRTVLYCEGHQYAGVWECLDCGVSDTHMHQSVLIEKVEVDCLRNGEHDTYETFVTNCADCGVVIEDF